MVRTDVTVPSPDALRAPPSPEGRGIQTAMPVGSARCGSFSHQEKVPRRGGGFGHRVPSVLAQACNVSPRPYLHRCCLFPGGRGIPSLFLLPSGEGGAQRRMRVRHCIQPTFALHRLVLPNPQPCPSPGGRGFNPLRSRGKDRSGSDSFSLREKGAKRCSCSCAHLRMRVRERSYRSPLPQPFHPVTPVQHALHPRLVVQVPVDGAGDAGFEIDGWFPAEFALQLG